MATLVFGSIGRVFGGPIGGLLGTIAGGLVDRSLAGGTRNGGRVGNLEVQSAAYGEPIPIVVGRMRVAGNLVWSSGIAETADGGKACGAGYTYKASFAVALVGGPIIAIGRIWADGTEIRNSAGTFASPVTMRFYRGSETQKVDPLIAAAEGGKSAPAYRGIAYAVFEDLPLAEFGNRIPNLSFEIIADDAAALDMGAALRRLSMSENRALADVSGRFPAIAGHVAARAGSIADNIAPLVAIAGVAVAGGDRLALVGDTDDHIGLPAADGHARSQDGAPGRDRFVRQGGDVMVSAVELSYFDGDRVYQAGLQRARGGLPGALVQHVIASAMPAALAKQLATELLARSEAARLQTSARLPWRHVGIRPGAQVRFANDDRLWRVRATRFEAFVVFLELECVDIAPAPGRLADAGRALSFVSAPAGATEVLWLDLPSLPGEAPVLPRLWLAAAGAAPGWRRAPLAISRDGGFSYQVAGMIGGGVQGAAANVLVPGCVAGWDRFSSVDVELLSDAMWLQPASEAAVLAGANLALIGDELVQFATAKMLAPRRFRLSGLLRGRQGSEAAVAGHAVGERFVLLERGTLLAVDLPLESIGQTVLARANGSGDANSSAVAALIGGRGLLPLSPAHLRVRRVGGDIVASWARRSRAGFGWPDFIDAPLAEAGEAYRVDIWLGSTPVRTATVTTPAFVYSEVDRHADGGAGMAELQVRQISALVGPGAAATGRFMLP
ncbi:MAG: phage tail baseplate protein [Polymorphobacter sp.]